MVIVNSKFGVEAPETSAGHKCSTCDREMNEKEMNEKESEIFDNLEVLEESITSSNLLSLCYIAGYIVRNDKIFFEDEDDDTYEYYKKHFLYLDNLNRGGLRIPGDPSVQWVIFCYLLFLAIEDNSCVNFLIKVFMEVPYYTKLRWVPFKIRFIKIELIKNFCTKNAF